MNKDTSQRGDDSEISKLYQAVSNEEPSSLVSDAILTMAKKNVETTDNSSDVKTIESKTPGADIGSNQPLAGKDKRTLHNWRRWQWPASIAASVVFVTVIMFNQFEQFDPNQVAPSVSPVDTYAIADSATLDEQSAQQRQQLEMKKPMVRSLPYPQAQLPEAADIAEQTIAEPELSNYAEQEVAGLASRALDNIELDIVPEEFSVDPMDMVVAQLSDPLKEDVQQTDDLEMMQVSSFTAREEAQEEAQQRLIARQSQQNQKTSAAESMEQSMAQEVVVTGSRVARSEETASVKNDYLDSLISQLKALESKTPVTSQDEKEIIELQSAIFDYLMLQKTLDPTLDIEATTLEVLTPEQRRKLTN